MGRAQSQFIRIYDASSGSTYQRWQSYYGDATVSWDGAQWAYVPFTAEGFTEGISGDEANITISAPAIPLVVGAFNTAIRRGDLVDITMYEFDAELGNNAPQAQQQQHQHNSSIDIRNLSSGEKQIISLFSKIYLESSEEFILLFDEPELSLSIEWQKILLPDILKSGKCKLLLAVTHSPFIFDNELDLNASDLDTFLLEK